MSYQDDKLAEMAQQHENERAQAAADKVVSLDRASTRKTWENISGPDVSAFILQRMDELEELPTPQDPERKGELKGHEAELQIISDYLRRLDENRSAAKPKPPTYFFLTVKGDSIVVEYVDGNGTECSYTFKDVFDYHYFITLRSKEAREVGLDITVMASSSLDFPRDYSSDQSVIDLARAIRSRV